MSNLKEESTTFIFRVCIEIHKMNCSKALHVEIYLEDCLEIFLKDGSHGNAGIIRLLCLKLWKCLGRETGIHPTMAISNGVCLAAFSLGEVLYICGQSTE